MLALAAAILAAPLALASHGITTRVSVGDGDPGAESQEPSGSSSVSADGRFVAFTSGDWLDPRHVEPDTPTSDNIYVRDRLANETHLVSLRFCAEAGNGGCDGGDAGEPFISANGRYVAFTSDADDIEVVNLDEPLSDFADLRPQIFVHDRETGETFIVTVVLNTSDNIVPRELTEHGHPSLSEDGSLVAFQALPPPILVNGSTFFFDVFVASDWATGGVPTFTLASPRDCDNGCVPGHAVEPMIAAGGRFVAFTSAATNIQAAPGEGELDDANDTVPDVFVHDLDTETTEIVSLDTDGNQRNAPADQPSISADGDRVAFRWEPEPVSPAGIDDVGLLQLPPQGDVYVRDRDAGTTEAVSVTPGGDLGSGVSGQPVISGDGLFVAFTSTATDLLTETETTPFEDVFVRDLSAGTTLHVSVASDDTPGEAESYEPSINGDGFVVAFTSDAENLVPEDDNGEADVYVHDRGRPPVVLVPAASVNPDPLDFGDHLVGTTAGPDTVTVVSTGTAPLVVTDVGITAGDTGDFAIDSTSCVGAVLAPGALCIVDLTFTPTEEGPRAATLEVTDNAADSPQAVSLIGVGTVPALSVTPAVVDFGSHAVGVVSGDQVVTALSIGTGPVTITDVTVGGLHPGDFSATAGCSAVTLLPAEMCVIHVAFTPSVLGVRTAQLTLTHTAPTSPDVVTLTGVGVPAALVLSPDPVDFGEVVLGSTAGPLAATALNIGEDSITINAVGIEGAHAAEFAFDPGFCHGVTLLPGAACGIPLEFSPEATGTRTASLVLASTDVASPHSVTLTGRVGVAFGPAVQVTPDVLDFQGVLIDTASPEGHITVTSVGTTAATISSVTNEGDHPGDFAIIATTCNGAVLQPGEQCTVRTTFTPTEPGPRRTSIRVHSDAPDTPQSAQLQGTGLDPLLELDPPLGRRGFVTTATGSQFPPLTEVTLAWDRGIGTFVVTTDADGTFELTILVLRRDVLGPRLLEATGDGFAATAEYLVVPGPVHPPEFTTRR